MVCVLLQDRWEGVLNGRRGVFPNCFVTSNLQGESSTMFVNKAKALVAFEPRSAEECRLRPGDVITLQGFCPDPSFTIGVNESLPDKTPKKIPRDAITCNIALGLFDFQARFPHELSFHTGDVIVVSRKWNDGWWEGSIGDRSGIFPSNYTAVNMAQPVDGLYPFCFKCKDLLNSQQICVTCSKAEVALDQMIHNLDRFGANGYKGRCNIFEGVELEIS
eukprot:TRINITY_DN17297_c0_g1_i6.p1 TRINITY_DN17297_c0_g1~~TRINITY_DN17297_c0_g1_i6.p1  ORF type:complete len:219 (+),score=21.37 TRINITY_DN17297_c0_g1_i6:157-813(+)